jgi:hypothetical protein
MTVVELTTFFYFVLIDEIFVCNFFHIRGSFTIFDISHARIEEASSENKKIYNVDSFERKFRRRVLDLTGPSCAKCNHIGPTAGLKPLVFLCALL